MAGMSRKEIAQLLDHIEPQGVRATRTTKGVMLRFPDGKTTAMLHFTGSDVKEKQNVKARLKRAGITWPGEEAPLPDYITSSAPSARTLNRVQAVLAGWEQRYVTGTVINRLLQAAGERPMNSMTAQAALFHLGWVPTGKSTARKWMRPLELEPEPVDATPEPQEAEQATLPPEVAVMLPTGLQQALEAASEPEAPPVVELRPAAHAVATEQLEHPAPLRRLPEVQQHPAGHEYIDSADSWTADPAALPEGMTLPQLMAMLHALGLEGEIRVWRRNG